MSLQRFYSAQAMNSKLDYRFVNMDLEKHKYARTNEIYNVPTFWQPHDAIIKERK